MAYDFYKDIAGGKEFALQMEKVNKVRLSSVNPGCTPWSPSQHVQTLPSSESLPGWPGREGLRLTLSLNCSIPA